jgi:hypothetical protein
VFGLAEGPVKALLLTSVLGVAPLIVFSVGLGACTGRFSRLAPVLGGLSRVHLREKESQNGFSLNPVEITQLYSHFVRLLLRHLILLLEVFLAKLGARLNQRQEFGQLLRLLDVLFLLQFSAFLLLDLFEGFEEELLDV